MEHLHGEAAAGGAGYRGLGAWNFSDDVLTQCPHDLLAPCGRASTTSGTSARF
jgi:hypothetical protein